MRYIVFILSVLLMFSSCEESFVGKCFSGETEIVRREIPLDSTITRLYVMKEAEVHLLFDDEQKIEIEFPENLIEDVDFNYEKGNLYITNNVTCKWRKDDYAPKLYLSVPDIKRFDILDFATVVCDDTLKYEQGVKFYSLGTGDFHLLVNMKNLIIQDDYIADFYVDGKVENMSIQFKNVGRFYGKNLKSQNIKIDHLGENSLYINPLTSLTATLHNNGNVYAYHRPETIEVNELSSGKVYFEE